VINGESIERLFTTEPAAVFCPVERSGWFADQLRHSAVTSGVNASLVIHNGDVLPSLADFEVFLRSFTQVFSVNATQEHVDIGVIPIPQGLENASYDASGRPQDYPRPFERDTIPAWRSREVDVFASFRVSTNPRLRSRVRQLVREAEVKWLEPSEDQTPYLDLLKSSRFVLSPRGNGPDCHRTWEAIYWGCIPVIETDSLGSFLVSKLPILEVEDFAAFLALPTHEQLRLGERLNKREVKLAFMSYWCERLSR
jgi:hypothetical protein